jgi:hypothetical protein
VVAQSVQTRECRPTGDPSADFGCGFASYVESSNDPALYWGALLVVVGIVGAWGGIATVAGAFALPLVRPGRTVQVLDGSQLVTLRLRSDGSCLKSGGPELPCILHPEKGMTLHDGVLTVGERPFSVDDSTSSPAEVEAFLEDAAALYQLGR